MASILQVRTQTIPYLNKAEENELKDLKTTTDEELLAIETFGLQKAREAPLLGIGEERGWWDFDSNSGIFYAILAHSFTSNYWTV